METEAVPSALPPGEPVPATGPLTPAAQAHVGRVPFSVYVHVPFCATRCGYCDFNTYTADELGPGASRGEYVDAALRELSQARTALGDAVPEVSTVFVGGGTPTLLPPQDLARLIDGISAQFGLADGAEITTEANPESVDAAALRALRDAGFTRISFGMQSIKPHVLQMLDRAHIPGRPALAVAEARAAGFDQINLDLIYGTPGETDEDWVASVTAALAAGPDHVSAYSLIVEEGTAMAGKVRRGEVVETDDDALASRYEQADDLFQAAGLQWYEVSNWARPGGECRHNLGYWRSHDWWGIGPGAHSHVGGVRWWNRKHPADYARSVNQGESPAAGREVLDDSQRQHEDILLRIRLAEGVEHHRLGPHGPERSADLVARGLALPQEHAQGRLVLTRRGRLLADAVVRELV